MVDIELIHSKPPLKVWGVRLTLRGTVKKQNSIFKDIVQIGGREVNPISKN